MEYLRCFSLLKKFVAVVLLLCTAAQSGYALPSQKQKLALERAKQAISAAYKAEDIGYGERDVDVALSYHSPGYTSVDSQERTLNFDRTHEGLTALFFVLRACQAQTIVKRAALTPEGVGVVVLKRITMTPAKPGSPTAILTQTRHDTWVRNVLGWRLFHSVIDSESKTVGGKSAPKLK